MPRYKVSYTDCTIRECFTDAESEDAAEELARAQFEDGEHHHTCYDWADDWQTEKALKDEKRRACWECGR